MDNQNRFEETPEKVNPVAKFFKSLGRYFKSVFLDTIQGFRYNMMKIPAILIAVPGIFLGFFLTYHAKVVRSMTFTNGIDTYNNITLDISGLLLFILMLCGIFNIFNAVGLSSKKNLGSVIKCLVVTVIIVGAGAFYLFYVFSFMGGGRDYLGSEVEFTSDWYISIASVIVSMATSIIGCILGFIWYDRTYEKVDR